MQTSFDSLSDRLFGALRGDEVLLLSFDGEETDFVRLNKARVRQAGRVVQRVVSVQLVDGGRHATARLTLSGDPEHDAARAGEALAGLREQLPLLPEDPHLLYNTGATVSRSVVANALPPAGDAIEEVLARAEGLDLVGIWASGGVHAGFATSLGQRSWFTTHTFNLNWSIYDRTDKAVKCSYAGTHWEIAELDHKLRAAREQLEVLRRPARSVTPGKYRVYFAPAAVKELLGLMCWGGFSKKAAETKRSPLLRAIEGRANFSPLLTLTERSDAGMTPNWGGGGFLRPAAVPLITSGQMAERLVSPRSAREFGVASNGASDEESPDALFMAGGDLAESDVLGALGDGIWISNLWYLNFSDRAACRGTGMTRFATLLVEGGEVVAPLNVMRFDDSFYRVLGEGLLALTQEPEILLESSTYGKRQTGGVSVPGALVQGFTLTL